MVAVIYWFDYDITAAYCVKVSARNKNFTLINVLLKLFKSKNGTSSLQHNLVVFT